MADPGERNEQRNAYQKESQAKLPDATEFRFKQNRLPRCRGKSARERQPAHVRNFQPKPKQSGEESHDQTPSDQAEQAPLDLVQIVGRGLSSRAKSDQLESKDSSEQHRRTYLRSASND